MRASFLREEAKIWSTLKSERTTIGPRDQVTVPVTAVCFDPQTPPREAEEVWHGQCMWNAPRSINAVIEIMFGFVWSECRKHHMECLTYGKGGMSWLASYMYWHTTLTYSAVNEVGTQIAMAALGSTVESGLSQRRMSPASCGIQVPNFKWLEQ